MPAASRCWARRGSSSARTAASTSRAACCCAPTWAACPLPPARVRVKQGGPLCRQGKGGNSIHTVHAPTALYDGGQKRNEASERAAKPAPSGSQSLIQRHGPPCSTLNPQPPARPRPRPQWRRYTRARPSTAGPTRRRRWRRFRACCAPAACLWPPPFSTSRRRWASWWGTTTWWRRSARWGRHAARLAPGWHVFRPCLGRLNQHVEPTSLA